MSCGKSFGSVMGQPLWFKRINSSLQTSDIHGSILAELFYRDLWLSIIIFRQVFFVEGYFVAPHISGLFRSLDFDAVFLFAYEFYLEPLQCLVYSLVAIFIFMGKEHPFLHNH